MFTDGEEASKKEEAAAAVRVPHDKKSRGSVFSKQQWEKREEGEFEGSCYATTRRLDERKVGLSNAKSKRRTLEGLLRGRATFDATVKVKCLQ